MKISRSLAACLEDLEARIDVDVETKLFEQWQDFALGRWQGNAFSPVRLGGSQAPQIDWPAVRVNDALQDHEQMLLQQYRLCSDTLAGGDGRLLCVRANYGTILIPLLFGAEVFLMDSEANTLPASRPIPGGAEAMRRLIGKGVPNVNTSFCGRAFETAEWFKAVGQQYPKIGRFVYIYHLDAQGPMDIAEMLWGSDIFYGAIDHPDLLHELLQLITETYIAVLRRWEAVVPPSGSGVAVHWGMLHQGRIMLRDDSAMNFSPKLYEEFIRPYDQRLLAEFGGGAIHFCGKCDHYIGAMSQLKDLYAVNMSQQELNNVETVLRHTVDKGICLLDMNADTTEKLLASGRPLRGKLHYSGRGALQ
jgi:hypothetical protein